MRSISLFRKIFVVILTALLIVTMSSCRTSPALLKIIYTNNATVDQNVQEKNNDIDNEELDELLSARKENEEVSKQDFLNVKEKPQNKADNTDKKGDSNGNSGSQSGVNNDGDNNSKVENATTPTALQEQVDVQETETRTLREIVISNGNRVKIPENVSSVAACGDVAPYVAMLGGTSYIKVTSESFKNNQIATEIFGINEMSQMLALFSGTGNTYISDYNFKQLLKIKPDVCFVVSGQLMFTDSQLKILSNKLIYVVTLPKLNTTDNIKAAVNIIATVLGDSEGQSNKKNAPAMATLYLDWLDRTINNVKTKNRQFSGYNLVDFNNDIYVTGAEKTNSHQCNDGFFTLFISSWDNAAAYNIGSINGYGMPITSSGYSNSPMSYAISLGGAANAAALSGYIPRNYYISPLGLDTVAQLNVSGSAAKWDAERSQSMVEYTSSFGGTNGMKYSIGSSKFNTIIVGTQDIKNRILSSPLWTVYPKVSDGSGEYNGISMAGLVVRSYIVGGYNVVVTPGGVGNWTSGSPEVFLESIFVNSVFYGDYSSSDLSNEIRNFYSTFYGKTPSPEVITKIVSGYAR